MRHAGTITQVQQEFSRAAVFLFVIGGVAQQCPREARIKIGFRSGKIREKTQVEMVGSELVTAAPAQRWPDFARARYATFMFALSFDPLRGTKTDVESVRRARLG